MEHGGQSITEIKFYECGYCVNQLSHVFRRHPKEKRNFPALVVLIKHKEYGNILFDTGYSKLIYQNGFPSFLYNAINKSFVNPEDTICSKLISDGIDPESVKKIILSHAHPDHIGGLNLFNEYQLISTEKVLDTLKSGRVSDLVFKNMIPKGKVEYSPVKKLSKDCFLEQYFSKTYDVLGDGSVIGAELNGHAKGQLGVYLPEYKIFLVADACWGRDLLQRIRDMRFIPRRIQNNFEEYCQTGEALLRLTKEHPEIQIIYSHDHNLGGTNE